jgi:hypothetical protein
MQGVAENLLEVPNFETIGKKPGVTKKLRQSGLKPKLQISLPQILTLYKVTIFGKTFFHKF